MANIDFKGALSSWKLPPGQWESDTSFVCRSWEGISCSAEGRILSLAVNNPDKMKPLWGKAALMQSIPPSLSSLTDLTSLDLSYNGAYNTIGARFVGLVGPIPTEFFSLTKLVFLSLSYNSFSGSLSDSISNLKNLRHLDLSYNILEGPVPRVLSTLVSLTFLRFGGNYFTGPLPDFLSALTNLQILGAKNLPLQGPLPTSLGTLPSLQYLTLAFMPGINGTLPDSFSGLRSLKSLSLSDMNITGELPPAQWWKALAYLNIIDLQSLPLQGNLPQAFGVNVSSLTIAGTNITGPVTEELIEGSLCSPNQSFPLEFLQLQYNQLTGPFPAALSTCASLGYIRLEHNRFSGEIPENFFQSMSSSLSIFRADGNDLTGSLPKNLLASTPLLSGINVSSNGFTGTMPKIFCATTILGVVDFSRNKFHGDIGELLADKSKCTSDPGVVLHISDNLLTGELPQNWHVNLSDFRFAGNNISGPIPVPPICPLLSVLNASRNSLSGPVSPLFMRNCSMLNVLDLSHNNLNGTIPWVYPKRSQDQVLDIIDLSNNNLSGTLPASLEFLPLLRSLDLSGNQLSGPIPTTLTSLSVLQVLDLSFNLLNSSIPEGFGSFRKLLALNLSSNSITGIIPGELAPPFLPRLGSLDLSRNSLSGPIPYGFLSSPSTLLINLSSNNLSGAVPGGSSSGPFAVNPALVANNSELCGGVGMDPCPMPSQSNSLSAGAIVGIVVSSVVAMAVISLVLWYCLLRTRDEWSGGVLMKFKDLDITMEHLLKETNFFSEDCKLGRGGFGTVYKATLPDGSEVAIKRLKANSSQGDAEFKAEVQILGKLSHRNLVTLLAAYISTPPYKERLLIYEFVSGGSLDKVILTEMPEDSPLRLFEVRLKVALDVARALKYLHHDCSPGIIHRDVKPGNVLLDLEKEAKLADFGMAREMRDVLQSHMTESQIFGTAGYVAPEYNTLGRLSFKSDVYAFGVTLIQLMTGRRTSDAEIVERGLHRWASVPTYDLVDPTMEIRADWQRNRVLGAIRIGTLCIARVPCDRPTMEEVVGLLANIDEFVQTSEIAAEVQSRSSSLHRVE